jgi:glycosyltransferase involved in cell wall biosynthesis
MWYPHFKFPPLFCDMLDKADYIFSVEEEMANTLETILKRKVACIPHPCDTAKIKSLVTKQRWPMVGAMLHAYDGNILLPALAINAVLDNKRPSWRSTVMGGVANDKDVGHLYDNFLPHNPNFEEFLTYLSQLYAVVESYTFHSYGRTTIECAALGVPVIGSDIVSSQRRCFPDLCTDTASVKKTSELLERLITDPQFWTSCAQKAVGLSDYYSFENCRGMMLDFLNGIAPSTETKHQESNHGRHRRTEKRKTLVLTNGRDRNTPKHRGHCRRRRESKPRRTRTSRFHPGRS